MNYDELKLLGTGSNGLVYDIKNGSVIKRLLKEKCVESISSIREFSIMLQVYRNPFIVEFKNYKFVQGSKNILGNDMIEDNISFIFEKADMDLYSSITEETKNFHDYKNFMFELLLAIKYIHDLGIIHRDIKPENILVFKNDPIYGKMVKLTDFGMAINYSKGLNHTPYVGSSRYKSPEICTGTLKYGFESDIWALGITFFEMVSGKAYFNVSTDPITDINMLKRQSLDILANIIEKNSIVDEKIIDFAQKYSIRKSALSLRSRNSMCKKLGLTLPKIKLFELQTGSKIDEFCNLLENMLKFFPEERFNVDQCLNHPFFSNFKKASEYNFEKIEIDDRIIFSNKNRDIMANYIYSIFVNKKKYSWYYNEGYLEHRVLFQAINIFDRYMLHCTNFENIKGMIMNVILYMSFKFFNCLGNQLSISEVCGIQLSEKELIEFIKLEKKILNAFCEDGYIYCDTIYEYFASMGEVNNDDLTRILIIYIKNNSISGLKPCEFYQLYKNKNLSSLPIKDVHKIIFH